MLETFWRAQVQTKSLRPAVELGIEIVNCEGVSNFPMQAAVLKEAGKNVVAWADQDTDEARDVLKRLRKELNCGLIAVHSAVAGRQNLEGALAQGCSLEGLVASLSAIAEDREYKWDAQREDLISRAEHISDSERENMKNAPDLRTLLMGLQGTDARTLVASALAARNVTPFSLKGGRQARILANTLVEKKDIPNAFTSLLQKIEAWVDGGLQSGTEIEMDGG